MWYHWVSDLISLSHSPPDWQKFLSPQMSGFISLVSTWFPASASLILAMDCNIIFSFTYYTFQSSLPKCFCHQGLSHFSPNCVHFLSFVLVIVAPYLLVVIHATKKAVGSIISFMYLAAISTGQEWFRGQKSMYWKLWGKFENRVSLLQWG